MASPYGPNDVISGNDSNDESYEMSEELSDDDDSILSGSVDHEIEEILNLNTVHDDPFLYELCDPQFLVNNMDDNEVNDDCKSLDREIEDTMIVAGVDYPIHDPNQKWKIMKPSLGEKFVNPAQLKFCITNYAVANGLQLRFEKNESSRLSVRCSEKVHGKWQCPYRLYAAWMSKERTFQVKYLEEKHTCPRDYAHNPLAKPTWIAQVLLPNLIKNQELTLKEMQRLVFDKYLCNVSIGQCQRAKTRALYKIEGSLVEHYNRVWDYGGEILRSNPGSTVKINVEECDNGNYFKAFYVCFKALKDGWKEGCRPVIGLDGCFLKSICRGELLTAIGRDANNQVYPIAWAVVDIENKANWRWFLKLLLDDLELSHGMGITLISDQHKGLIEAVKEILPYAEHRQCARHVYANFKKKFNGLEYKNLFWGAAMSTVESEFEKHMSELKERSDAAYNHLIERDPNTWCRAFFEADKACEAIENGICESFNKMILVARKKPVITLLETIRLLIMQRMHVMRNMANEFEGDVCPAIMKKLNFFSRNYRLWDVVPSGGHKFEVRKSNDSFCVDLEKETCTCKLWQLSGVPCVHGIASIYFIHRNPEDYVSHWFRKANFLAAYQPSIQPMHDSKMWVSSPYIKPLPPKERRMPGRPTLKRKRHPSENENNATKVKGQRQMTCKKCQGKGHNHRSCKNDQVDPPPKSSKPRGRPKLNIGIPASRANSGGRGKRGGRGGRGAKVGKSCMVGVSYHSREAMIHSLNGDVRPAWPAWAVPRSVEHVGGNFSGASSDVDIGSKVN